MPDTPANAPRPWPWKPGVALLVPYSIVVVVAAFAMARRGASLPVDAREVAQRLASSLLLIETVALAVGVPLLAAQETGGWRRRLLGVAAPVAALALVSFVVSAVAAGGRVSPAVLLCCQVFLLSFAALLAGGMALLAALGLRPTRAQLVVTAAGLAMLGSLFAANAVIESLPTGAPRTTTIQGLLWTNPWLIASGSLLRTDPVRAKRLYHQSVVSYYGFRYPASGHSLAGRTLLTSAAYLGAAVLLWGGSCLLARLARRRAPG